MGETAENRPPLCMYDPDCKGCVGCMVIPAGFSEFLDSMGWMDSNESGDEALWADDVRRSGVGLFLHEPPHATFTPSATPRAAAPLPSCGET